MESQILATTLPESKSASKPALVEGAPLFIDPAEPQTWIEALQRTARAHPTHGIHVIGQNGSESFLSYPELLERAARVLSGLRQHGIQPGTQVILQFDSLEQHFAAFWGCVLGGIIPVTIAVAPTYQERNGVVDKLCNTWRLLDQPPILTTKRLESALKGLSQILPETDLNCCCIEDLQTADRAETFHSADPADVVFIQLSSGSTGIPKCIQEAHRSIIAHVHSSQIFNDYRSDDVTLNWLPLDHVVPLLTFHLKDTYLGCDQVHVPTDMILAEPLLWLDLLQKFRATHTWSPNFGFKLVSDRLSRSRGRHWDLSHVKFFMNAGEQVTMPVVREFLKAVAPFGVHESTMQPAFGMAEVCTCMTYANDFSVATGARRFTKASLDGHLQPVADLAADSAEFVTLGKVAPGVAIRIVNAADEVVPERTIGRFQIKGRVVTPGYYRNEEANAASFVGDGWFNTGDVGFIDNQELHLTGREKEIIIIRGAKFYCYEIEDVVSSIPGVEATFAATCSTNDPETGTEKLAVFFSPAGVTDELAVVQAVRKRVTARLGITPGFVVPIPKHQFPKTTSGKIQRTQLKKALEAGAFQNALEEPIADSDADPDAPRNEIETQVVAIWREVLGGKKLHLTSHLFELGGDSLKATQIASRIREHWQIEFPPQLIFGDAGTVEGMARWIADNAGKGNSTVLPPIQPAPANVKLPLSASQLRLWLAEQISPGTSLYNIGRSLLLKGTLDFARLERALTAIAERHAILRTIYALEEMPVQIVLPKADLLLPRHDIGHLTLSEKDRVLANLMDLEISRPFDLATGPLWRAKLIRLGNDEHLLLLTFHQIVTDAWSLGIFFRELAELYNGSPSGDPIALPPLTIQYADYALWQQQWMAGADQEEQLTFWKKQFAGIDTHVNLSQRSHVAGSSVSGIERVGFSHALMQQLRAFNAAENVTSYMTLLTAYKLLLSHRTGAADVVVGAPESGRRRLETEKLLGCFVNMLALRTPLLPQDTLRTALHRVGETIVQAFAHADVPFENVQAALPRNAAPRSRLFQVWFGPIDSLQPFTMGELRAEPQPVFPPVGQFDLSCFVAEHAEAITCFFEYQKELFTCSEIADLLEQFQRLLAKIISEPETTILQAFEELGRSSKQTGEMGSVLELTVSAV